MNIKPILFNTETVRAILDGRKTVTRRIVKLPKNIKEQSNGMYTINTEGDCYEDCYLAGLYADGYLLPRYKTGDILYVRESQSIHRVNDRGNKFVRVHYKADDAAMDFKVSDSEWYRLVKYDYTDEQFISPYWTTKETCRIFLKVMDVRVERLQDITEEQAIKEGFTDNRGFIHSPQDEYDNIHSAKQGFYSLWDSTVKDDSQKWESNPWVWVIEFERCEKPERWCGMNETELLDNSKLISDINDGERD